MNKKILFRNKSTINEKNVGMSKKSKSIDNYNKIYFKNKIKKKKINRK